MAVRELNGIRIAYDDAGTGPALVLVHGHPFDRSMWSPQVASLASRCRVVAPDLRGYGASGPIPDPPGFRAEGPTSVPHSRADVAPSFRGDASSSVLSGKTLLSTFAADLLALVDDLGIERFALGGLSMGGQIVMECYRQFPNRITALLLADTFPRADDKAARDTRLAAADRMAREGTGWYAAENLAKMIAPYNVEALPPVADHVRRMMLAAPPQGAAAALRGRAERPDYRQLLTTVTVPTLIVVGADDEFTPVSDAEEMHALLPNSTLVVIDRAAHLPNLEQPDAFNAAVHTFLDTLS